MKLNGYISHVPLSDLCLSSSSSCLRMLPLPPASQILIQCPKKIFECLGHSFWHQIVNSRRRNDPECHSSFATHIAAIWSKLWWWNWMVTSHIHMSLCLTSVHHHHHHHHALVCFPFLFRSHLLEDLGSNCEQQDEESRIMPSCITNIAAVWSELWWWHWTIPSHKSLDLTNASGVSHRDHAWLSRLDIFNVTMWCFRSIAESAFLCGRFSQLLRKKRVNLIKWSFGEDEESWWQMAWGCYKWKDKLCLIGLGVIASNWRTCDGRILTRRGLRLLHERYSREAMMSKDFHLRGECETFLSMLENTEEHLWSHRCCSSSSSTILCSMDGRLVTQLPFQSFKTVGRRWWHFRPPCPHNPYWVHFNFKAQNLIRWQLKSDWGLFFPKVKLSVKYVNNLEVKDVENPHWQWDDNFLTYHLKIYPKIQEKPLEMKGRLFLCWLL